MFSRTCWDAARGSGAVNRNSPKAYRVSLTPYPRHAQHHHRPGLRHDLVDDPQVPRAVAPQPFQRFEQRRADDGVELEAAEGGVVDRSRRRGEAEAFVAAALFGSFVVGLGELGEEEGVVGDGDGFAEGEVFVGGDQNRDRVAVAGELGAGASDGAFADDVAHVLGEVEQVDAFHDTDSLR